MSNKVSFIFKAIDQFTGVGKKIGRTVDKVTKKFGRLGKTVNKVSAGIGRSLGALNNKFVGLATAAAGFFSLEKLITTGAKFQDSLANLSAITGATGKDLKFLSDESLRLAKSSAVAQDVVAQAFTEIASAKSELLDDPKALSNITEQALLLSNAAGIDVTDAVKASVGALNQFGAGADQAARFVDVLAAGSKVGASVVGEVVQALKNAGPVAAQFGVTFEETNAILQVLAKSGIKGAEAGVALRNSLVSLEKIEGGKLAPSRIGVIKSLELLNKLNLDNLKITKEFGKENLTSALILRDSVPLIKEWTGAVSEQGIAQKQAEFRLGTFNAKIRKLGVSINDALIKTFLRLEPILTEQVTKFTEFLGTIDEEQIRGFADVLVLVAKTVAIIGKGIGFVVKQIANLGTVLGEVTAAIVNLDFGSFSDNFFTSLQNINPFQNPLNALNQPVPEGVKNQTDINVNLRAPEKTIESIKSETTGKASGLNIGVNMATGI